MRVIGLEEHLVTADVIAAWRALDPQWQDSSMTGAVAGDTARRLPELGAERFAAMADTGVDVQVLSLTAPGLQNLAPDDAAALQGPTNDVIADAVRARPDRLHHEPPHPRPREHPLDEHRPRNHARQREREQHHERRQRGPERVPPVHRPRPEPLRPGGAHEVAREHLPHPRARVPRDPGRTHRGKHDER